MINKFGLINLTIKLLLVKRSKFTLFIINTYFWQTICKQYNFNITQKFNETFFKT